VPAPRLSRVPPPEVDRRRIGISYSGGGALFLVELGIARAFVARRVLPDVIAGVSAGAFAAVAHGLDPAGGRGIASAARLLGHVDDGTLGLRWWQVALHLLFVSRRSLGDPSRLRRLVLDSFARDFGLHDPRLGDLVDPEVHIGAADRLGGEPVWFPAQMPIVDALIASAAIPAVFPWVELTVRGVKRVLVDGGLVHNQPLSELVLAGCGTIFAASVGPFRREMQRPHNLVDNAVGSACLAIHQSARLEEAYVREVLRGRGTVLHVQPVLDFPVEHFNFDPEVVRRVMDEADRQTREWLIQQGY
jgi:predicted acylesterase/phospholipase RssA